MTFVLQIIVTSLTEVLPTGGRVTAILDSKFAKSRFAIFVLPGVVCLIGFFLSLSDRVIPFSGRNFNIFQTMDFTLAALCISLIIVPLSLLKKYNRGHETLSAFAMRHRDNPLAKIFNVASFVIAGMTMLGLVIVLMIVLPMFTGMAVLIPNAKRE